MSTFTEAETYHTDIFKLDVSTPVKGGNVAGPLTNPTDGEANAPLQALADRTAWLKSKISPIGEVIMWPAAVAPGTDFLICNGASLLTASYPELFAVTGYSFGGSGANFNLPDLRGEFIRGWDAGAGTDPQAASRAAMNTGGATGDNVGTIQGDMVGAHAHKVPSSGGSGGLDVSATPIASQAPDLTTVETAVNGTGSGIETRPNNAALNFIIRANLT